ncbi:hypothetical protein D4M90_28490, partial [Klebsiella oxytoca]
GTVCVVGKMRDLILQLSKSSIYSTKPCCDYHSGRRSVARNACSVSGQLGDSQSSCVRFLLSYQRVDHAAYFNR